MDPGCRVVRRTMQEGAALKTTELPMPDALLVPGGPIVIGARIR